MGICEVKASNDKSHRLVCASRTFILLLDVELASLSSTTANYAPSNARLGGCAELYLPLRRQNSHVLVYIKCVTLLVNYLAASLRVSSFFFFLVFTPVVYRGEDQPTGSMFAFTNTAKDVHEIISKYREMHTERQQ